jgi:hypothetical protein
MHSPLQFEIEQLRMRNLVDAVMSILGFFAAIFATAILPTLLVQYVIPQEQLLQDPLILQLIPVISFVAAFGYFLYTVIMNIIRSRRAAALESELRSYNRLTDDGDMISEAELAELETIVEDALKRKPAAKKSTRATTARKTTKAASRKKPAAKRKTSKK